MKVIKENTAVYKTLYESLEGKTIDKNEKRNLKVIQPNFAKKEDKIQKRTSFFDSLATIHTHLSNLNDVDLVSKYLTKNVATLLKTNDSKIFLLNDTNNVMMPVESECSSQMKKFVDKISQDGILDYMFEANKSAIIPNYFQNRDDKREDNFLIIPIKERDKNKGVYCVHTPIARLDDNSFEIEAIKILLSSFLPKIEFIAQRKQLNSAYKELQVYQSKLSNDFKLSAIGELTAGIIEDIMDPAQVILSCTDFLKKEYEDVDNEILTTIDSQVSKVKTVITRLTKFASINNSKSEIFPCKINDVVSDYVDMIFSSLRNKNYECILDLEDNIPPILSNKSYINQLMANIFTVLKINSENGGGIFIQSKYLKSYVSLSVLSTDYVESLDNSSSSFNSDVNLMMINSLMSKHEGSVRISSSPQTGTSIILQFPLKRKIR